MPMIQSRHSVLQNNMIGLLWEGNNKFKLYAPGFQTVDIDISRLDITTHLKSSFALGVYPAISAGPLCHSMRTVNVDFGEPDGRTIYMKLQQGVQQQPIQRVRQHPHGISLQNSEIPNAKRAGTVLRPSTHMVAMFGGKPVVGVGIILESAADIHMNMVRFDWHGNILQVMYQKQSLNLYQLKRDQNSVLQNTLIGFQWLKGLIKIYTPGYLTVNVRIDELNIPSDLKCKLQSDNVLPVISAGPGCEWMRVVSIGQGEPNGKDIYLRGLQPSQSQQPHQTIPIQPKNHPSEWACTACTLLNTNDLNRCSLCNVQRSGVTEHVNSGHGRSRAHTEQHAQIHRAPGRVYPPIHPAPGGKLHTAQHLSQPAHGGMAGPHPAAGGMYRSHTEQHAPIHRALGGMARQQPASGAQHVSQPTHGGMYR
eukprot:49796_1